MFCWIIFSHKLAQSIKSGIDTESHLGLEVGDTLLLSKTAESEFGDGPKKGDTANIMGLSPPTSPLMGYGRRTFDESISAKKSAIRLIL